MSNESDLSGWEIVNNSPHIKDNPVTEDLSNWQTVSIAPASEQSYPESFGQSAIKAPFRVAEDLYKKGAQLVGNTPEYWNQYKTELPGFWKNVFMHPGHMAMQGLAGANEAVNMLNHVPPQLAQYANERLHLLPAGVGNFLNKITPDTTEDIQRLFGEPKYPGEALLRGTLKNELPLLFGKNPISSLSPLNLTYPGIAGNIVKEGERQIGAHTKMYNNLFQRAEKAGINTVPVDDNLINRNLTFIKQYKSPRDYRGLETFEMHPTLQNAQAATSDLKGVMRGLDEKSKGSSLTSEEKKLYDAADETIKHIESNMFMSPEGTLNALLANRHQAINRSYRENVVPYRYNKAIQDYINEESTAPELINSLSKGAFARKKGSKHPAIKIRNNLPAVLTGAGTAGGLGWLYNQMFGNNNHE